MYALQCYILCPLSQAGQSAIIDAVWTEVLHQLLDLVASLDLRDEVLWSCNIVTKTIAMLTAGL